MPLPSVGLPLYRLKTLARNDRFYRIAHLGALPPRGVLNGWIDWRLLWDECSVCGEGSRWGSLICGLLFLLFSLSPRTDMDEQCEEQGGEGHYRELQRQAFSNE